MPFKPLLFFSLLLSVACNNLASSNTKERSNNQKPIAISFDKNPYRTISAIPMPEGFMPLQADSNLFAVWLSIIPLKQNKTVYLYNGLAKNNQLAQFAVLDISVGNKNLQQCADAVMRLRAEYLFKEKRFTEISFTDNEHGVYSFKQPYSRENFNKFLERIFGSCGSASLAKQLKTVNNFMAIKSGDVLIKGGFPGHAVIIIAVAVNNAGKKIFMLAQSYMPAQDIHILKNPANESLSPWYEVNDNKKIITPEYTFYCNELKAW